MADNVRVTYESNPATDAKLEIKFTINGDNAKVEMLKATAGYKLFAASAPNGNAGYIQVGNNLYGVKSEGDAIAPEKVIQDFGKLFALIKVDEDGASSIKVADVTAGKIALLDGTDASGILNEVTDCNIEVLPATE